MMKSGGCGVILRMLVSPALQQQTTTDAVTGAVSVDAVTQQQTYLVLVRLARFLLLVAAHSLLYMVVEAQQAGSTTKVSVDAVTGAVSVDGVTQQQAYLVLVRLAWFLLLVAAHSLLYMVVEAQQAGSTTKVSVYAVIGAMSVDAMTQQQTYLVLVRLARFLLLVGAHALLYMVVEAQQAGSTTKVSLYDVTGALSLDAMTQQQMYLVLARLARFLLLVAAHSLLYMVVEAQQAGSTTKVSVYAITGAVSLDAVTQQQTCLVLVCQARFLLLVAAHSLLYMVVEAQQAGSTTKVSVYAVTGALSVDAVSMDAVTQQQTYLVLVRLARFLLLVAAHSLLCMVVKFYTVDRHRHL